jgi:hypothetical protein
MPFNFRQEIRHLARRSEFIGGGGVSIIEFIGGGGVPAAAPFSCV